MPAEGSDVEHPASFARDHAGQKPPRQVRQRRHVEIDQRCEIVPFGVVKGAAMAHSGIVDEVIDLQSGLVDRAGEALATIRRRQIARLDIDLDPVVAD